MGKGEIAQYEQFLLFTQGFQKTFTAAALTLKPGFVWEGVKQRKYTYTKKFRQSLTSTDCAG